MKHLLLLSLGLTCGLTAAWGQVQSESTIRIAERGPHHRVWERVTTVTAADGSVQSQTNSYTELETGMNVLANGVWQEATEEIEILADHALARNTAHQVIFAANLASSGAVDLKTPDGKRFLSHIVGLCYFDSATGQAVLLAEPKESIGEVLPPNQVYYLDAFDDVKADVLYVNSKCGLEQNIVLREQPPAPESFGLNPKTTRLQVLTEFTESPKPTIRTVTEANGLASELLDFGAMQIGRGRAFSVGADGDSAAAAGVAKQWLLLEGRRFLVEEVRFTDIDKDLSALPKRQAALRPNGRTGQGRTVIAALGQHLAQRTASRATPRPMQIAKLDPGRQPGFVLDYAILSSAGNFTFQGDTTYYVTNTVNLSGAVTIEGGTIVKVATNTTAKINLTGTVVCHTGPYRPAVFTAKDDNTVGETISGSTGTPVGFYGGGLTVETTGSTLHDMRLSYANKGIVLGFESGQISLANLQCVNCQYPIYSGHDFNTIIVDNSLFYSGSYVVYGGGGSDLEIIGRHLTVHNFTKVGPHTSELSLTNSLVVGATWGSSSVTTDHTTYYSTDPAGIFQTVGAAGHYLADDTYRNQGTLDISPTLLSELRQKTTYPPTELTVNFGSETTLGGVSYPLVPRDTTCAVDLGYHYDPLDYVVSGRDVSANLRLEAGVALGTYGASSSYGLGLSSGSFVSEGTATRLNWIVRYNTVQEQSTTTWSASTVGTSVNRISSSATVKIRFTGWSLPGGSGEHFNDTTGDPAPTEFTHSQFGGGKFTVDPGSVALTNCLLERVYVQLQDDDESGREWVLFNNLFYGGTFFYRARGDDPTLRAYDNLFDQTAITKAGGSASFAHGHNGYVSAVHLAGSSAGGDVDITSPAGYLDGPLGKYYYPTTGTKLATLINVGSRSAADAGLSDSTTRSDQTPDSGTLDIGFHYKALGNAVVSDWVFTDEGFIAGGQVGAFRTYYDPNDVTASPWSFQSADKSSLRISFEDDYNCCDNPPCYNPNTQQGTAVATIWINSPTRMTVQWSGVGETEDSDFEKMSLFVECGFVGSAHAPGGGFGCDGGMAPVVSDPSPPQYIDLQPGVHFLRIETTTNDPLYHIGAYYQFALSFEPL